MSNPLIFTKDTNSTTLLADLSDQLTTGETTVSSSLVSVSPVSSSSPLTFGTFTYSGQTVSMVVSGGNENVSYGVQLSVVTSLPRTITVTLAVLVKTNLNVPYATRNPQGFQTLLGTIEAGDAAVGRAMFVLPAGTDASQGFVTWEVLDHEGTVYGSGNAYDFMINIGSFGVTVSANAVVNLPSSTPPSLDGQAYQIRWTLDLQDGSPVQNAYETLVVTGSMHVPTGPQDAVEMAGDTVQLSIVVPRAYAVMQVELFSGNVVTMPAVDVTTKARVSSGWMYTVLVDTSQLSAALEAYTISWKYRDSGVSPMNRETARLYLMNPSMLAAIQDIKQSVAKARSTTMGFEDTSFDVPTVASWLRRGRDEFNSIGGLITSFTMTNAKDGIREYWLRYSEVAMLRAQALAEGEKAFDFQGQSISLNVDRTQYYQSAADSLQSALDQQVIPFKKTLSIRGNTGGDGSGAGNVSAVSSFGVVGVGWNAVSPGYPYFRPGLR